MSPHAQRREAQAPIPTAATAADARKLAENLLDVMSALLSVIERETELVRAGKLREAMEFEPKKSELSRRYISAVGQLQASQKYLMQSAPELLTALHRHHDTFRAMLQINLTVLATAHAVSEGIMRRLSGDLARKSSPQVYGASGRATAPDPKRAQPLAFSRVL